jgi:hypothetical protein
MASHKSTCKIRVSIGELYDKYSILHIKREKINNEEKLLYINKEIEYLKPLINEYNLDDTVFKKLKKINALLWDIEDNIRIKETKNEFDSEFILLAREVYKTNDQRYIVKNEIDNIFNSEIKEIKSYV